MEAFNLNLESKEHISTLLKLAENEISAGRSQEALQYLLEANRIDQENNTVFAKLGHCYSVLNNYNLSYICYCKALQGPDLKTPEEVWFGLAELYYKQQKYIEAEPRYNSVLNLNPSFEILSTVYLRLAVINKKLGKVSKAIEYFKASSQCRDLSSDQINELLLQLASCFELAGENKNAFELYLEALKIKKNLQNLICVSWILIKNGRAKKSQDILAQAKNMVHNKSKEYYDIEFFFAISHIKLKNYSDAIKIFINILAHYPNEPYYLIAYGVLEENLGNYSSALQNLWRALALLPERQDILSGIGCIYEKIGHINQSSNIFSVMSELFPEHEDSKSGPKIKDSNNATNTSSLSLDILRIDITEFPFHKGMQAEIVDPQIEITVPKLVYYDFNLPQAFTTENTDTKDPSAPKKRKK
jgi:tetratricopeptide (TPR) repeat protein